VITKAGFIAIIGQPNVGKSTLLNQLVGMKLAGVSKKAQTTRQVIRGILTESRGQIVYLDTPGFHTPKDPLGKYMIREVAKTFIDADLFYFMVDPKLPGQMDLALLDWLKTESAAVGEKWKPGGKTTDLNKNQAKIPEKKPVFCLINKCDTIEKHDVLPVMETYQNKFPFDECMPVSALEKINLDLLLERTFSFLPEHEPYFPGDYTSDQPERFLAAELIREKLFRFTGQEVPYSTTVGIESFREEEKIVRIEAVIYVERESQKAILIGARGEKMKQIGTAARLDLEQMIGRKVFLQLWVKVLKNWKRDEKSLKRLGFE